MPARAPCQFAVFSGAENHEKHFSPLASPASAVGASRTRTSFALQRGTPPMKRKTTMYLAMVTAAVGFAVGGGAGCEDNNNGVVTTADYTYDDAYLYDAYYPADVAYAGYYWANPWDYTAFYYI